MALTAFPKLNNGKLTPFPKQSRQGQQWAQPEEKQPAYSDLSAWDLLKAGDIKGLANRIGGSYMGNQRDQLRAGNTVLEEMGTNAARDVGEWGGELATNVGKAISAEADLTKSLFGSSYEDFQKAKQAGKDAAWGAYETAARPAGMAAITPGVPAPVRAVAGAVYAPKFASDVINSFQGAMAGGESGPPMSVGDAALATAKSFTVDPLKELTEKLTGDPQGLAQRIKEHPANLWDEVLAPATIAEMPARAGHKAYTTAKSRYQEAMQSLDDIAKHTYLGIDHARRVNPTDRAQRKLADAKARVDEVVRGLERRTGIAQAQRQQIDESQRAASNRDKYFLDTGRGGIDRLVSEAAEKYNLPPELLHRVIAQESSYNPKAVSEMGAQGLMQLMPGTAYEMGVRDSFDPRQNIMGGAQYLRKLLDASNGDLRQALASYNAGPGNWQAGLRYADDVMAREVQGQRGTVGALEQGTRAWEGQRMPSGENGCVEAVTRIGSWHDPWLKAEADKGVNNVDVLVRDAGDRVIPFDEKQVERGDVIVYGDERDPHRHVVIADGNGGYIGNSSKRQRVVRGDNLYEMNPWRPTKIIKAAERQGDMRAEKPPTADTYLDEPIREDVDRRLTDMFGRDEEDVGQLIAATKEDYANKGQENAEQLQPMIDDIQRQIDEALDVQMGIMEDNPGGRGVDQTLIFDSYDPHTNRGQGNVIGRITESRNPQWYQDFYRENGRKPRKSEYPEIARQELMKEQEFYELDRELRRMQEVQKRMKENPYADIGKTMEDVATDIQYSKEPGKQKRPNAMSDEAIAENVKRGQAAINDVIKTKGNASAAMHRDDIGDIDVFWGYEGDPKKDYKNGYGVAHIIARRNLQGLDGEAVARLMPEVIMQGEKTEGVTPSRVELHHGDYVAVLESVLHGKPVNRWLLTGFKKYEKEPANARGEGYDSSAATTPTPTRARREGAVSSIQSIPQSKEQHNLQQEIDSQVSAAMGNPGAAQQTGAAPQGLHTRVQQAGGRTTLGGAKPKGEYSGDTVSRRDVFNRVRDLFGIHRVGRQIKGSLGHYDPSQDTIRVGKYGDWETLWHEIGHKIDTLIGLQEKAGGRGQSEAMGAMHRRYGNNIPYRPDQITAEGIAEFMREYMMHPNEAAQHFPTYSKVFAEAMRDNPDLAARVKEAREMMQKEREQGDWERVAGDLPTEEQPTQKQEIKNVADKIMTAWGDKYWKFHDLDKQYEQATGQKLSRENSIYYKARLAESLGATNARMLLEYEDGEKMAAAFKRKYGIDLHPVTYRAALDKLYEFEQSDAGKRFLEQNNLKSEKALPAYMVARRFMDVYDYKYTDVVGQLQKDAAEALQKAIDAEQDAALAKAELNAATGKTKGEIMKATRKYDKAHRKAVEARKAARKANKEYEDRKAAGYDMPRDYATYERVANTAPKELHDVAQMLWDLNDNVLRIMKNGGMINDATYKALREHGEHYCSLQRVFPDDARAVEGMTGQGFINVARPLEKISEYGATWDVKDPLQNMGENIVKICNAVERNKVGQALTDFAKQPGLGKVAEKVPGDASAKDSTLKVWIDGKQEVYQTTPDIYQLMQNLTPKGMEAWMKYTLAYPARWLRAGATSLNAAFTLKNMARDTLDAWLFSRHGFTPILDTAKGLYHMIKGTETWEDYKASGAVMSTIVNANKDFHAEALKAMRQRGWEKVWHNWNPLAVAEKISNVGENATRVGLFANARKKGQSLTEAAIEAREGTLDFGKSGTSGRVWNQVFPFLNAQIQGLITAIERTKENPRMMATKLGKMTIGSLALYAYIRSNDELSAQYDEMKQYEKDMFWNVPTPGGWMRYPKPFEMGMIGASLPERLVDLYRGDKRGVKEWAKSFLGDVFVPYRVANLTTINPLLLAGIEWNTGRSIFQGRDLIPSNEKNLSPEYQYGPETSWLAKQVGQATGQSPRKLDNLGSNLLGGAYRQATDVMDAVVEDKKYFGRVDPFTKALTVDPERSPQSVQDFYDRKTEVETAYNDMRKMGKRMTPEEIRDYKIIQYADKGLKKFSKQIGYIKQRGDRAELERVTKQRNEFIKHFAKYLQKGA